jgi:hypothetical protein
MPPSWDVGLPPPMIFQVAKGVYPVGEPEPRWRDRGDDAGQARVDAGYFPIISPISALGRITGLSRFPGPI